MSILIKGINVHRGRCWECPCLDGEYGDCNALKKDVHDIEYEECPIVEIPDHGDLIDRDALFDDNSWDWFNEWGDTVNKQAQLVVDASVVIPEERSEE